MNKVLLVLPLALLLGCKKDDPEASLPPATQEGKNTFGCLVNGQPWTPLGNNGYPNYNVNYDRNYANGTLNVSSYRYIEKSSDDLQTIAFASDSLRSVGSYDLAIIKHQAAIFTDESKKCKLISIDKDIAYRRGTLTITRLDLRAGIIAGTFDFTLYKPGCDTIRVTQGRFDKKL